MPTPAMPKVARHGTPLPDNQKPCLQVLDANSSAACGGVNLRPANMRCSADVPAQQVGRQCNGGVDQRRGPPLGCGQVLLTEQKVLQPVEALRRGPVHMKEYAHADEKGCFQLGAWCIFW